MGDISDIVGPDAETTTNEQGGKQSHIPVRFDLIDAKALFEQAKVLHEGAVKYGENNWRLIPVEDHLNHLITHAYAYLAGDRSDEHLSHIMCRATFAQGVVLQEKDSMKRPYLDAGGIMHPGDEPVKLHQGASSIYAPYESFSCGHCERVSYGTRFKCCSEHAPELTDIVICGVCYVELHPVGED